MVCGGVIPKKVHVRAVRRCRVPSGVGRSLGSNRRTVQCAAEGAEGKAEQSVKKTIAGIDALLGIDEEEEKRKEVRACEAVLMWPVASRVPSILPAERQPPHPCK